MVGRPAENIIGKRFGKLVVLSESNKVCTCKCDCGNYKIADRRQLKRGHTQSCGCLNGTHHMSDTRIYNIWSKMKNRCNNKNYHEFYLYGGRGIKVCNEWQDDFSNFYKWAVANGYSDKLSIDRINPNNGYNPKNCRWLDKIGQANNKRNNRCITVNEKTHTLSEWSRITGTNRKTLQSCMSRHGVAAMAQKYIDSFGDDTP